MKFQVNVQITLRNSAALTDAELSKALSLGKNEVAAIDVETILRTVAAQLKGKGLRPARRSQAKGSITVSLPVVVEGKHLGKINLTEAAKGDKKSDADKKADLMKELGL